MNIRFNQAIKCLCFILFGLFFCLSSQAQSDMQGATAGDNRPHEKDKSIYDGMCERIKNSKFFSEYAEVADRNYKSPIGLNKFPYDTNDKIVTKWLKRKIEAIEKQNGVFEFQDIQHEWGHQIAKCYAVLPTNLTSLFVTDKYYYERIHEFRPKRPKTKTVRDVDSSGNIVTKQEITGDSEVGSMAIFDSQQLNEAAIPGLIAIFDKDNKFITTIHPEIRKEWSSVIATIESYEKQEAENTQKRIKVQKENALAIQQQNEMALKYLKERNERTKKIQKGDFKSASSCVDIINVLGDKIDRSDGAAINPNQGLKATIGELVSFSGDIGIILTRSRSGTTGAEFKTSGSTHWINKNDMRLNSNVLVIGKYTSNTTIKLANGINIQSPFLELICIQPY